MSDVANLNWLSQIYLLLLFLRVLLSWFPAFNWERQPWLALRQVPLYTFLYGLLCMDSAIDQIKCAMLHAKLTDLLRM